MPLLMIVQPSGVAGILAVRVERLQPLEGGPCLRVLCFQGFFPFRERRYFVPQLRYLLPGRSHHIPATQACAHQDAQAQEQAPQACPAKGAAQCPAAGAEWPWKSFAVNDPWEQAHLCKQVPFCLAVLFCALT